MSKIHFEKLTPKQNIDLKIYNDALNYVFKNDDINNIAISGAYSAGKSSIIETYKKNNSNKKFLHISLANFKDTISKNLNDTKMNESNNYEDKKNNKLNNKTKKIEESILEGKILNQLLHQISPSMIPQTNFKIKQNITDKTIREITGIILVSVICFLHILLFNKWSTLVKKLPDIKLLSFLNFTTSAISIVISFIILIAILGYFIFNIIRAQKNKNIFKKLSVQGNEIEIFENNDESYFDKYLNEVLYLFDNSDVDVIVFEDMDRYNMNQIFQRLKEVNNLINVKRKKSNKEPLRFFYLLRDDIFISKDRTKFFDFIMPAVPVIDSSNSYNKFISHFKKARIFEKFNNQFLQRISLYIDDMRILKNIYNEFIIYNSIIDNIELDYNKLLAIISYKNIFPRDFAETQLNKGFVSTIFNNKEKFINNQTISIEEKISNMNKKLELCENEHLQNIEELDKIYTKENYYDKYVDKKDSTYIKRKEIIEIKEKNKQSTLKEKLSLYESKITEMKNKKICKLISRENEKEIFSISFLDFLGNENDFDEVKSSEYFGLIKYLIWEGYIDETYEDYMTYFYPNSLTANDKKFVRSILDKKSKEWNYIIDNPKLVISMLNEVDFREIEVLNYTVFNYLCVNIKNNESKLIALIKQFKNSKNHIFMKKYLQHISSSIDSIKVINHYWSEFLFEISQEKEFDYIEIKEIILNTLYYSNREDIDKINKNGFLRDSISNDPKFLNIENPKIEKLIKKFKYLDIEFKSINYNNSNKEFFKAIYNCKLYKMSYENILLMINEVYKIRDNNKIKHKNYSLIMSKPDSILLEHIKEEIGLYMELYLQNCDKKISDEIEDALDLLNNEDISLIKRKEYLNYLTTNLKEIKNVDDIELWGLVLEERNINYDENNILEYYLNSKKGLDNNLISFINSDINYKLDFSIEDTEETRIDEELSKLFDDVIVCNNICNKKYKEILGTLSYNYDKFEISDIDDEKIKILIELKIINMNKLNLEFLRSNYNSTVTYFIEKNIYLYIQDVMESTPAAKDEIIELINTSIEDNFKIILLKQISDKLTVYNKNYSNDIKEYILQNNFDYNDMTGLAVDYEIYSNKIRRIILDLCKEYIQYIIRDEIIFSNKLFELLVKDEEINKEYKISVLANNLKGITEKNFKVYITIIDYKEYLRIFTRTGRLPRVDINEHNKRLLDALKNKPWIVNYVKEENMYKIIRITKKRKPVRQ